MLSWESMHSIALGGLAPHITELSAALQRRGHEVHVFTRVGMHQSAYDCIDGVHYHRCPFESHPDFLVYVSRMCDSFAWHLMETEAFLGGPFDIIHGHDWLATMALAQIKHRVPRNIVFTVHSTEFGRCGNSVWNDPMSRRIRDLEWEGTYLAHRVICVSKTLGDEAIRLYDLPRDKVFPVYNGVDVHKYNDPVDGPSVRRSIRVGLDEPIALFCGRMTWQKGPDLLLEAIPNVLRTYPHARFVYVGDGDMLGGLKLRADALGVSHATRFLGHQKGQALIDLFKASDFVCVPSRNEPFGIVILEAWSASKSVVATKIGGPTEFVSHGVNGFTVDPGIDHIGEGIELILADLASAKRMGECGRREAESRFTWDHSAADTEKVYQSILRPPSADTTAKVKSKTRQEHRMSTHTTTTGETQGMTEGTVKSMAAKDVASTLQPSHDAIRDRAYQIYLSRNGAPGNSMTDWLQAETELHEEMTTATATTGGTTTKVVNTRQVGTNTVAPKDATPTNKTEKPRTEMAARRGS